MEKSDVIVEIERLESQGFTYRFLCFENTLQCIESGRLYAPEELSIVSVHRFEGFKDLDDLSVIYAVSDGESVKGLIVDAYGPYADTLVGECIRKMMYMPKEEFNYV